MPKTFMLKYEELKEHEGHSLLIIVDRNFTSGVERGLEIRCTECDSEPLVDIDKPIKKCVDCKEMPAMEESIMGYCAKCKFLNEF